MNGIACVAPIVMKELYGCVVVCVVCKVQKNFVGLYYGWHWEIAGG